VIFIIGEYMEVLCEFCGVVRVVVCCEPDSSCLCLYCDGILPSLDSLSRRHALHPHSLLCDKCSFDSAIVHCVEYKLSLCQVCDWNMLIPFNWIPNACFVLCCSLSILVVPLWQSYLRFGHIWFMQIHQKCCLGIT
jgi:hypothetical protein